MWAEKELHNLRKMARFGVKVPRAVALKKHVLVMEFIGSDGQPAPKLKDALLSTAEWEIAYEETLQTMRTLYSDCHLVHADLSEYNILWHEGGCRSELGVSGNSGRSLPSSHLCRGARSSVRGDHTHPNGLGTPGG